MKRWLWIWVLAAVMLGSGLAEGMAFAGQCVFQATDRVYLEIFPIDQSGMVKTNEPLWTGWLDEGMQTPFDSPDENVAYRVKSQGDDTGTDYTSSNCVDGEVILVP